jgi:hypothetical protein
MLQGYIDGVERYPEVWARLFELLVDPRSRPVLFHCTGKRPDRYRRGLDSSGLVPEETVVTDYGLSDGYNADVRQKINDALRPLGIDLSKVEPYFTAPKAASARCMYVDGHCGSAVDYLEKGKG